MGLLSRLTGAKPTKAPTDDVLLIHGMLLMAGADGAMEASEMSTVQAFIDVLPEFKGKDIDALINEGRKIIARSGGLKESVRALGDLSTPLLKKKLYTLAVDLAMSSGDIDESEDEMLSAMSRVMDIDETTASKVLEVLSWKYSK